MNSFVSQVCLLLLVSALFRWPCSISIHLSPRSITAGVRPFTLAMKHFYSFVSQVCHCWCPPFSAGHVAFLFICLPGLSLLVPALFRRPCNISINLSPRSVIAGVRPVPLAMNSFVSQVCLSLLVSALFRWPCSISIHLSPRSVTAGVRPFPLAFSAGHVAFLFICLPGLSLLVSALFRWPCSISIQPLAI